MNPYDLNYILANLPHKLKQFMMDHPSALVLAGGAIRSIVAKEPVNDYDVYGRNPESTKVLADQWITLYPPDRVHTSANAITCIYNTERTVQFITRWTFDTPDQVIDGFDFTICQAAVWYDGEYWQCNHHKDFFTDLAFKRLIYTAAPRREEAPGGSVLRVTKYVARGYSIQPESLSYLLARFAKTALPHINEVTAQRVFKAHLRMVDPQILVDGVSMEDHSHE